MSLLGLAAAGAGLAAGLALSGPANAGLDTLAWRQRARRLPRRGQQMDLRRSAAEPLLRQQRRGEALLARLLAGRERRRFERGFPDALALLIRALRAGQPVPAALAEVARGSSGPVARAFAGAVEAMRLGAPVEAALRAQSQRLGSADFELLVTTIALQRETGGNLAASLLTLDDTLRQRRLLVLKARAMSAEARTSALIIASMPFAMAALMAAVSPDYLVPLVTTRLGKALVLAGLASLLAGGIIIGQMMRVKT
jgi:tight adherence protein B